jgi:hypothetical protein
MYQWVLCTSHLEPAFYLTHDISHLIKLSFNTPKSTRGLDALLIVVPCAPSSHHQVIPSSSRHRSPFLRTIATEPTTSSRHGCLLMGSRLQPWSEAVRAYRLAHRRQLCEIAPPTHVFNTPPPPWEANSSEPSPPFLNKTGPPSPPHALEPLLCNTPCYKLPNLCH